MIRYKKSVLNIILGCTLMLLCATTGNTYAGGIGMLPDREIDRELLIFIDAIDRAYPEIDIYKNLSDKYRLNVTEKDVQQITKPMDLILQVTPPAVLGIMMSLMGQLANMVPVSAWNLVPDVTIRESGILPVMESMLETLDPFLNLITDIPMEDVVPLMDNMLGRVSLRDMMIALPGLVSAFPAEVIVGHPLMQPAPMP